MSWQPINQYINHQSEVVDGVINTALYVSPTGKVKDTLDLSS